MIGILPIDTIVLNAADLFPVTVNLTTLMEMAYETLSTIE